MEMASLVILCKGQSRHPMHKQSTRGLRQLSLKSTNSNAHCQKGELKSQSLCSCIRNFSSLMLDSVLNLAREICPFFGLYRDFHFFLFLGSLSPYSSSLSFTTQRGWNSLPVHQFTTCVLPFNNSHPLPSSPSTPFALSNSGMCLGCRDERNVRESVMIVIVPRGESMRASKDTGRLLAGWQNVNYRHQTDPPGGHRDISLKDLHRYGLLWSRLLTPPVGLLISHRLLQWRSQPSFISLSHTRTHFNICHICWCKPLLVK